MTAGVAFARSPEATDAVKAVQRPQARPIPRRPAAALQEAAGRAAAAYVPPSRVPVRAGAAHPGLRAPQRSLRLRECDCAQHPGTASCDACNEQQLQRSHDGLRPSQIPAGGRVHPRIASAIDAARGGGRPLERSTRERWEAGLGESLGDVRVHADTHAEALARAVSARAFTVGSDLFFAAGVYQPGSHDGDKLIAHEVTHTVQQRGAPASGPLSVSAPGEAAEVEAQQMASVVHEGVSTLPHGESASLGGHDPDRLAGAGQVTRGAAFSIARQVDPSSDDAAASNYQLGYNDGLACNPPSPGPLAPEYYQGYQDGQAAANAAQACLPAESTYAQVNPPGTPPPVDNSTMAAIPVGAVAYDKYGGGGDVASWISQACNIVGLPPGNWVPGYQVLCGRESGGNPNAVNDTDVNATGQIQSDGHKQNCSRGIAQVIPGTFAINHVAGTSIDIYDPVANIVASMRYVMGRYGVSQDGSDLASKVQQADPSRSPKGY